MLRGPYTLPPHLLTYIISPLHEVAVPLFFVISAFLFFRKYRESECKLRTLWHFWKRLVVLYLFWCIVWSPIIYLKKDYFHPISGATPLLMVKDFLFSSMFGASWFFGALLVCVPIVVVLIRVQRNRLVWLFPLLVYTCLHQQIDGGALMNCYETYFRKEGPFISFPAGLLWVTIGYLLSSPKATDVFSRWKNGYVWLAALVCFAGIPFVEDLARPFAVPLLFIAAYSWKLPEHPALYKRLRTYSILFYVMHDSLRSIIQAGLGLERGPIAFCVVIFLCFVGSEIIIRMKEIKGFGWLRYAY